MIATQVKTLHLKRTLAGHVLDRRSVLHKQCKKITSRQTTGKNTSIHNEYTRFFFPAQVEEDVFLFVALGPALTHVIQYNIMCRTHDS